jgi:hypothetical protein
VLPQSNALKALAERWANVPARETANFQLYVGELTRALDVPGPDRSGSA